MHFSPFDNFTDNTHFSVNTHFFNSKRRFWFHACAHGFDLYGRASGPISMVIQCNGKIEFTRY